MSAISTAKLIFDERDVSYDPLFALLDFYQSKKSSGQKVCQYQVLTIEEKLKQRIIDGDRIALDKDLALAMESHPPLEIINSILLGRYENRW